MTYDQMSTLIAAIIVILGLMAGVITLIATTMPPRPRRDRDATESDGAHGRASWR